jgi:hypothetical protein
MANEMAPWEFLSNQIRGSSSDLLNLGLQVPKAMMDLRSQGIDLKRKELEEKQLDTPLTLTDMSNISGKFLGNMSDQAKAEALVGVSNGIKSLGLQVDDPNDLTSIIKKKDGTPLTYRDGKYFPVLASLALANVNPLTVMNGEQKKLQARKQELIDKNGDSKEIGDLDKAITGINAKAKAFQDNPLEYLGARQQQLQMAHNAILQIGGNVDLIKQELTSNSQLMTKAHEHVIERQGWVKISDKTANMLGVKGNDRYFPPQVVGTMEAAMIHYKSAVDAAGIKKTGDEKMQGVASLIAGVAKVQDDASKRFKEMHTDAAGRLGYTDPTTNEFKAMSPQDYMVKEKEYTTAAVLQFAEQLARMPGGQKLVGNASAAVPGTPAPGPGGAAPVDVATMRKEWKEIGSTLSTVALPGHITRQIEALGQEIVANPGTAQAYQKMQLVKKLIAENSAQKPKSTGLNQPDFSGIVQSP